jgi:transcriptional regulator with XRE-family HTH domain
VSAVDAQLELGRRVAEQRRRYGWSQPELADRLGKPVAWISLLERGLTRAEPIPVLRALGGGPLQQDPVVVAAAGAIRDEQSRALHGVVSGARQARPRPGVLRVNTPAGRSALATQVWELTEAGAYDALAELLGDLVPALQATVRPGPATAEARQPRQGLHELLAICYQACSAALAKLGEYAAAMTAADRAIAAAGDAGNPRAVAAGAYLMVCILLETGQHDSAQAVAAASIEALAPLAATDEPEAICARGALTLLSALSAARQGDPATAQEHLRRARIMAGRLTSGRGDRAALFSGDHVAVYEIAVSIETAAAAVPAAAAPAAEGLA